MCVAGTTSSEQDEERWYLYVLLVKCMHEDHSKEFGEEFTSTRVLSIGFKSVKGHQTDW